MFINYINVGIMWFLILMYFTADIYRLQSCNVSSTDDSIAYKCSYCNRDVLLGCGIEAINIMNGDTNTSNTTSDNGVINGLCDGTYNVSCYGIPDPTSSNRIMYNDSKYNSLISITGSKCVVSSSMVEPSFTPTIGHDSTGIIFDIGLVFRCSYS